MDKILIIEDSMVAQAQLADILGNGFELAFRDSGPAGMAAAGETPPDLILLDIHLPGMDGYHVCRALKNDPATGEIPVIFITAKGSEQEKVKGFEAGAMDYIVKPFYPAELLARVRTQLAARQGARQALELEKLKLFKELAIALSHEINNPLTAIYGSLYTLDKGIAGPAERLKGAVQDIRREMERIRKIVDRLANASRIAQTDYVNDATMIDLHGI